MKIIMYTYEYIYIYMFFFIYIYAPQSPHVSHYTAQLSHTTIITLYVEDPHSECSSDAVSVTVGSVVRPVVRVSVVHQRRPQHIAVVIQGGLAQCLVHFRGARCCVAESPAGVTLRLNRHLILLY